MAPPQDLVQLSDAELCDKLRRDDHEQYVTLVRMHLSFVLDLNCDEAGEVTEKSKFRPLKWVSNKKKTKGVMEGAPLTQEGICQVYQLIEFLSRESNITQEGVFRRTGKLTRQQDLKSLLNRGAELCLDEGKFSVHDCASVLKSFLAELPEPLLTDAHYQAYCQVAEMCAGAEPVRLLRALQLLLLLLPAENRALLSDVLNLLHLAASHENMNKMSADNLATLFTPHLLCPRKLAPEELHVNAQIMSKVVSFMITKGQEVFSIPPKLATDIRAYWSDKDRQDGQPKEEVNTVFSFVDRQLTAAANSSNPTEAALAHLYAHIQSLPESAHKKRLVKQFNKENGHGTPLHMRPKQSHLSRSLGDSIKKHLLTKAMKKHKQGNASSEDILKSPERTMPFKDATDSSVLEMTQARRHICPDQELQENMMTPRSRKPVMVLSSSNLAVQFATGMEEEDSSSASLTSTFREYLISRSVLTATPVSLSAAASPDKLSSSLLYCLDGHEPSSSPDESSSSSRKRSADSSLFADQSISLSSDSAKKSTLESSYASTMDSCVRETSL